MDWRCAAWLYDHDIAAVAADNLMVEDPLSGSRERFCRCTCSACGIWG
ncbi:putative metal-dependent hydrolase domain protein [Mycobacterium xenopi 4042]|uniref:Putative metal-dependent hydrolase domain protein n=1 Tax=Mycobacterium xenopi 4042 TaxID=1299334 RepID=X8AFY1_MYCXE|nr:putative metal-dependent hydrolase domain protein [Mycobacterium xenopi 4042]